jgi:phenylpropionate dioxygenase-like ring-hydroxylating dioxygenase large terminal subunit
MPDIKATQATAATRAASRACDLVPAERFIDPSLGHREREKLWPRVWQTACRLEELPEVGDYVVYEILDESILVVRTAPDAVSGYYNVCQHRARRLQDKPRGNVRQGFYCRFHGWRYGLDGSLQHVPDEEDWFCENLRAQAGLKQVRVETWAGWVWINMDLQAQSLLEFLGPVATTLAPLELERTRRHWHKTLIAPVNWKVVVGAFSEGYHAGATHDGGLSYRRMKSPAVAHGPHTMYFSEWAGLVRMRQPDDSWAEVADLREHIHANCLHLFHKLRAMVLEPTRRAAERLLVEVPSGTPDQSVAAEFLRLQREETQQIGAHWPQGLDVGNLATIGTGWHVFPNTVFLPTVDGALWYRFRPHPDDSGSCVFDMWSLGRYAAGAEPAVTQENFDGFEAFKGQNPFLEEDFDNMIGVAKGMQSRGWHGALLNPLQELPITTFMRTLGEYVHD